mgnify:CR=1 FL=1
MVDAWLRHLVDTLVKVRLKDLGNLGLELVGEQGRVFVEHLLSECIEFLFRHDFFVGQIHTV